MITIFTSAQSIIIVFDSILCLYIQSLIINFCTQIGPPSSSGTWWRCSRTSSSSKLLLHRHPHRQPPRQPKSMRLFSVMVIMPNRRKWQRRSSCVLCRRRHFSMRKTTRRSFTCFCCPRTYTFHFSNDIDKDFSRLRTSISESSYEIWFNRFIVFFGPSRFFKFRVMISIFQKFQSNFSVGSHHIHFVSMLKNVFQIFDEHLLT